MEQPTVFSKEWFSNPKTQAKLLWLLNHSHYFRQDMGINNADLPFAEKIVRIEPNSFTWRTGEKEFMTDFRTHDKFGKRLYYGFYPVWDLAHKFDMSVANKWIPSLNLGFDTLTVYPVDGTTVSGDVSRRVAGEGESWSSIRVGGGTENRYSLDDFNPAYIVCSNTTNGYWTLLRRSIFLFDTSALTSSATISGTTMSLYGISKYNGLGSGNGIDLDVYTSTPASNTALQNSDFGQIGTTSQTGSPISWDSFNTSAYNDFVFDSTGKGNVSKTGISKFGVRNSSFDVLGGTPHWVGNNDASGMNISGPSHTGTSQDPKLVVTYSLPSTGNFFLMF